MRSRWLILLKAKQSRNSPSSTCALSTSFKMSHTSFRTFNFFLVKYVVKAFVPTGAPSSFTPSLLTQSTSAGNGSPLARDAKSRSSSRSNEAREWAPLSPAVQKQRVPRHITYNAPVVQVPDIEE